MRKCAPKSLKSEWGTPSYVHCAGFKHRWVSEQLAKDPAGQWDDWAKIADDGGLARPKISPLLTELHDKDGQLITRDSEAILELLEQKRSKVFAWRDTYSAECEEGVNRALLLAQEFNADMIASQPAEYAFAASSIVALQAADPLELIRASDTRRGYVRDLRNQIAARKIGRFKASERGDAIRQRFAQEVELLECDPSLHELGGIISRLKGNKGSGTSAYSNCDGGPGCASSHAP